MPAENYRFKYNDVVWSKVSGNFIDMGGLMKALAIEMANMMKQPINTKKAQ